MALVLTDAQTETVTPLRKNEEELPTYFDASLQTDVTISRDFEAFLILSEDDLKTSAIEWIKKVVDIQKVNTDRDTLTGLALAQEKSNAQAKVDDLDGRLQDFNDFREKFQTSTQFAVVPEVQQFLLDLQSPIAELIADSNRAEFDNVACQVIERLTRDTTIDDLQVEELQSWTGVLSVYLSG